MISCIMILGVLKILSLPFDTLDVHALGAIGAKRRLPVPNSFHTMLFNFFPFTYPCPLSKGAISVVYFPCSPLVW
jgi:hypothetical protein